MQFPPTITLEYSYVYITFDIDLNFWTFKAQCERKIMKQLTFLILHFSLPHFYSSIHKSLLNHIIMSSLNHNYVSLIDQ